METSYMEKAGGKGKGRPQIGNNEIQIDYFEIEQAQRELREISGRIRDVLSVPFVMRESRGRVAEELRDQYECLREILKQMKSLTDNIEAAVGKARYRFEESDVLLASRNFK